ncbi:hypothetical protein [Cellulomonas palmilytica]|uniref:hypothetical protein n=1 Tax=Cellulomonas palmilytica TaxID=2608402 RepID=UPI001F18BFC0|nr:hypothetical protein [Cellulomonas palmilytica]UJP40911.1 hypothetical protein F1D97_05430 [Cellulomonas palmilytica]
MNLDQMLNGARDEIAQATAPIDDRTLTRVRGTVRRARIQRHTFESVGAAACAGVLGLGAWTLASSDSTAPVDPATRSATPDPSLAPTAEPSPTDEPTTADDGPVERADEIDDATVIARLAAPRTGERWHDEPIDASDALDALFTPDELTNGPEYHLTLVGDREVSAIYALELPALFEDDVVTWGTRVELYEIDEDGPRAILCPSARTGDACAEEFSSSKAVADRDTFYDTLTLPASLPLAEGWALSTEATRADVTKVVGVPAPTGSAAQPLTPVAELGALTVVQRGVRSEIDGARSFSYAVLTPLRTLVPVADADVPGLDYRGITWDDGVDRSKQVADGAWAQYAMAPAVSTCSSAQVTVDAGHDPAQWRTAGSTADGRDVVVPAAGNPFAAAVHRWQLEHSGTIDTDTGETLTGTDAGYPYATVDAFLDAQSLYGVQGPDGEWNLHLRPEASNVVWECV